MQRRDFIRHTSLGIASTLVPQGFSGAEIILGQNQKRYRINRRWSQADVSKYPVNDCHEMVEDRLGRILLLTNDTRNNVLIYDKNGKILEAWGTDYPGAHGLTLFDENGTDALYICDNTRHQVIKTDIKGKVLLVMDYPKEAEIYDSAASFVPTETAIAANGDIYIADGYGKDFIIQYDAQGRYIRHFGGKGGEAHHLKNAHGICVDLRDKNKPSLLVTSREENAFKRFDMSGNFIETIALPGAWVCRPVIKGEYLYAAVLQSNSRQGLQSGFVTILNKNNRVISNLAGSTPNAKGEMYQTIQVFQYPHDVCVDNEENLYVCQWNSGKTYPFKLEPLP